MLNQGDGEGDRIFGMEDIGRNDTEYIHAKKRQVTKNQRRKRFNRTDENSSSKPSL